MFPTTKGKFKAEITQVGINRMWMHRIHISLPEINAVAVRPGRRSIGFLTENTSSFLNCGLEVGHGDLILHGSDVVHQRSDTQLHYGTVSFPADDLATVAEAIIGHEMPEKHHDSIARPCSALMNRLQSIHKSIGLLACVTPDILRIPQVARALETELAHIVVSCLADSQPLKSTASPRNKDRVFARFVDYLRGNPDRPLYLTEVCAAIGVAERTLRASCMEQVGIGPIRYLTLRRMHLVRLALLSSNSSTATVTQIVTDHGFWELGRFSVAYRSLFGESPSDTLRDRSPPL
ncbi:MAG TPA: helix-turn-helix domain-containing protein, partial [Pyrinomonadaceae bacterium]|nr:helix-turn-helix domain-containing protein [Pyrinomonadaceae bacterium]